MKLAKVINGTIQKVGELAEFGCFSMPPLASQMEALSVVFVQSVKPINTATQKLVPCAPYIEAGVVFDVIVAEKSAADIQADKDSALQSVRYQRNAMLAESDWTQLLDAKLSPQKQTEWAVYRQALRDIPEANMDLRNFTAWPSKPSK